VTIQPPNLPVLVGLTSTFFHFVLPASKLQSALGLVAFGALFTWVWLELFQGVNYFWRGLGLLVLIGLLAVPLNVGSL
jgi:hypothetical protein